MRPDGKTVILALAAGLLLFAGTWAARGDVETTAGGTWHDWPAELEAVRAQTATLRITGRAETIYQIPLRTREELQAVWPSVLTVKSPGGVLTLVRAGSPDPPWPGASNAGPAIRIHAPHGMLLSIPKGPGGGGFGPVTPEMLADLLASGRSLVADAPWPESAHLPGGELPEWVVHEERDERLYWVPLLDVDPDRTAFRARVDIELVVDGEVVDLNRIRLPDNTRIIDEREL